MYYYKIDNKPYSSEIELNEANGYGHAEPISEAVYNELINPTPIEPSEFELKKAIKQDAFNAYAFAFIYNGYTDIESGYKLFTSKDDISNYTILLNSLQFENDDTQIEFGTMLGWTSNKCLIVKDLLKRYSQYCRPITTKILRLQTEIAMAQTVEQLNAIII